MRPFFSQLLSPQIHSPECLLLVPIFAVCDVVANNPKSGDVVDTNLMWKIFVGEKLIYRFQLKRFFPEILRFNFSDNRSIGVKMNYLSSQWLRFN